MESKIASHSVVTVAARNKAVELLRCFLMFLIVLGHGWGQGIFAPGQGLCDHVDWWVFLMVGGLIWHVDGFVAISGWFGVKFSFKKLFYLIGTIAFYTVLIDAILLCRGHDLSLSMFKLRSGWFGGAYLALMLVSPFLNEAVDSLASHSRRRLIAAWLLIAVVAFLTWAPGRLATGINALGFGHQTFMVMAFVYLTVRVIRNAVIRPLSLRVLIFLASAYLVFVICNGVLLNALGNAEYARLGSLWRLSTENHSPIVYSAAIVVLLIFVWYVKVPNWLGRIVAQVSPVMFDVYLFHGQILLPVERWLHGTLAWHPFFVIMLASVLAFLLSVLVGLCRRFLVELLRRPADTVLRKMDSKWNCFQNGGCPK